MSLDCPDWHLDNRSLKPRQGRHNRSPQRKLGVLRLFTALLRLFRAFVFAPSGANTKARKTIKRDTPLAFPQLALGATVMPPLAGLEDARR